MNHDIVGEKLTKILTDAAHSFRFPAGVAVKAAAGALAMEGIYRGIETGTMIVTGFDRAGVPTVALSDFGRRFVEDADAAVKAGIAIEVGPQHTTPRDDVDKLVLLGGLAYTEFPFSVEMVKLILGWTTERAVAAFQKGTEQGLFARKEDGPTQGIPPGGGGDN